MLFRVAGGDHPMWVSQDFTHTDRYKYIQTHIHVLVFRLADTVNSTKKDDGFEPICTVYGLNPGSSCCEATVLTT